MLAELDSPLSSTPTRQPVAVNNHRADWSINMAVHVNADARRISQALTEPEYLEAWVRLPDQREDSALIASRREDGFHLEHRHSGRVDMQISGSYLFRHQRKMRLFWRKAHGPFSAESIVDFRVRGNFGSSLLELRHMDFNSADEFLWHKKLWQDSLEKLSQLLQSA